MSREIYHRKFFYPIFILLGSFFLLQYFFVAINNSPSGDEFVYLNISQDILSHFSWKTTTSIFHAPLTYYIYGFIVKLFSSSEVLFKIKLGRCLMVGLSLLLIFYILLWSFKLYGKKASLFSLFLCCFSISLLSYGPTIMTDVAVSAFFVMTLYHCWQLKEKQKIIDLLLAGSGFGLALLSKYSAVLLLVIFVPYIVYTRNKKLLLKNVIHVMLIILIGCLVLDAGYLFQGTFFLFKHQNFSSELFQTLAKLPVIQSIPVPIPKAYVYGIDFHAHISQNGYPSFLLGKLSLYGWWYYYPFVFLIKTPISFLILMVLSLYGFLRKQPFSKDEWFVLVPVIFLLVFGSLFMSINGALRHFFVVYAFLYIFCGRLILHFRNAKPLIKALIIAVSFWYGAVTVFVSPHFISYFNEFIGGSNQGYQYVAASDIDLSQDIHLIGQFTESSAEKIVYPGCRPIVGKFILTPNFLSNVFYELPCYDWVQDFTPVEQPAPTLLVYNISLLDYQMRVDEEPNNVEKLLDYAWALFNSKENNKSEEILQTVLQLDFKNSEAHQLYGIIKYHKHDYSEAITSFREALKEDPNDQKTNYWLALVYLKSNEKQKAYEVYRQAIFQESLSNHRGDERFRFDRFIRTWEQRADSADKLNNLGFYHWLRGEPKKALVFYEKALNLCDACPIPLLNATHALFDLGEVQRSQHFYELFQKNANDMSFVKTSFILMPSYIRTHMVVADHWLFAHFVPEDILLYQKQFSINELKKLSQEEVDYIVAKLVRKGRHFAARALLLLFDQEFSHPLSKKINFATVNW